MAVRGGVLLRATGRGKDELFFVPADVVRRVVVVNAISKVEGLHPPAHGVALIDGEVVVVLSPSMSSHPLSTNGGRTMALLCEVATSRIALCGHRVEATGLFLEEREGFVQTNDSNELAAIVDVAALYRKAEEAAWSERNASHPDMEKRS